MKACWKCGAPWLEKHTPGIRIECEKCFLPLHACANCRFYSPCAYQWCGEPMARGEKPKDPETGNSCSFFLFADKEMDVPESSAKAKGDLSPLFGESAKDKDSAKNIDDWRQFKKTDHDTLERMFKPPERK